jgi:hypothetical protein
MKARKDQREEQLNRIQVLSRSHEEGIAKLKLTAVKPKARRHLVESIRGIRWMLS